MIVTKTMLSNNGVMNEDNRAGAIFVDNSSEVEIGDKFIIKEIKSITRTGWNSDGSPKFSVYQKTLTAIDRIGDVVIFFPSIISEGEYRNSTSMIVEGMEMIKLFGE